MTDTQLYLAIGVPILANATLIGLLLAYMNARFDGSEKRTDARFDAINARFDSINARFDDMRDLWRSELHRVEEVLDARLKHLEKFNG